MLTCRNVWKSYRVRGQEEVVLRNVSFVLHAGDALGILGAPGTGKSTLLALIGRMQSPERGSIETTGTVSWPIGFRGWLAKQLTPEENIRFVASLYGWDADAAVDYTRGFAQVKAREWRRPWNALETETQERIAFAATLAMPFDIYLTEGDPAVGGGPFRQRCYAALEQRKETAAILLAARKPQQLEPISNHYAVLRDGELRLFRNRKRAVEHFESEAA